jgi:hypothetical protein
MNVAKARCDRVSAIALLQANGRRGDRGGGEAFQKGSMGAGTAGGSNFATLLQSAGYVEVFMPRMSDDARHTLSLVGTDSAVSIVPRLQPPDYLSAEQRAEFVRLVDAMPADWFSAGSLALVVQLVRHTVMAKRIAARLEEVVAAGDGAAIGKLVGIQNQESRTIKGLMTSLRLSPQSTSPRFHKASKLVNVPSPWGG